jgi:hypothetical protein
MKEGALMKLTLKAKVKTATNENWFDSANFDIEETEKWPSN